MRNKVHLQVGPLPWLGPFTDDALKGYASQGKKNFILVPVAFVNEHIETLHEMDIEYCKDLSKEVRNKINESKFRHFKHSHQLIALFVGCEFFSWVSR